MRTSLVSDLVVACRSMRTTPAAVTAAVVALGLGIGLTSVTWSIVYAMTMRGLPFPGADRIMSVDRRIRSGSSDDLVPTMQHDLADWRERQRSFEGLGAFQLVSVNLSGSARQPERIPGARLTANTFSLLRVQPARGRAFVDADEAPGAPAVAIISSTLWSNRFGSDPAVVGRTVRVGGVPTTIVGVMDPDFRFPLHQSIWLPLPLDPLPARRGEGPSVGVFGRLRTGVALATARREFSALADDLRKRFPDTNRDTGVSVGPFVLRYVTGGDDRAIAGSYTMLAAVFGVLLIACANVSNFLLARAVVRRRELAVRAALGAPRRRLMSLVLAESTVIAALGGVLGTGCAWVGLTWFRGAAADTNPPFWLKFELDPPILIFVIAASVLSALVAGVVPALRASRPNMASTLNDVGRGGSSLRLGRLSRGLVAVELIFAWALLLPAGTITRSIINLQTTDFGFAVDDVMTARITLPTADYPSAARRLAVFEELLRRVQANPAIRAAAAGTDMAGGGGSREGIEVEGRPVSDGKAGSQAGVVAISPDYFTASGVALLEGRAFTTADRAGSASVAIVNSRFADRFLAGGSPVGRRVRVREGSSPGPWLTVVGVVPDLFFGGLRPNSQAGLYVPLAQSEVVGASLIVRTAGPPAPIVPFLRAQTSAIDAELPLDEVRTMRRVLYEATLFVSLFGTLFIAFGLTALVLTAVGAFGVATFSARQRTHEIGIRVALGATGCQVVLLMMKQSLWLLGGGGAIGLAFGLGLSRLVAGILYRVSPADPLTLEIVTVVLVATTGLAHFWPAWQAARLEPVDALR
ncbi:MAG TPA: ABC transporter permease [Vicinamibacterales bacterium]